MKTRLDYAKVAPGVYDAMDALDCTAPDFLDS
jgi:hypothetical protein